MHFTNFSELVGYVISEIFSPITALILALAVVYFFLGVLNFIRSGDNESERAKARNMMIYGIIGLAVMVSVWGLVHILTSTFDLDNTLPQF